MVKTIGFILVGHGSRNHEAVREFNEFGLKIRQKFPSINIGFGFIELSKPNIEKAIDHMVDCLKPNKIVLIPIFLFSSKHIKNDLPIIIERAKKKYIEIDFISLETFKVHRHLINLLCERVKEALPLERKKIRSKRVLLVIGRGASDPDSNGDFQKIVRIAEEKLDFDNVFPCYIGIVKPKLEEVLEFVSRIRPKELMVVPYLLFTGVLIRKAKNIVETFSAKYPWIKTTFAAHLGVHSFLIEAVEEKIKKVLKGEEEESLSCMNCHYRPDLGAISKDVKGVEALLWSVRHMYTHSQVAPHEFPHKNLKKHVLICENIDCAKKGALPLASKLRRYIKDGGHYPSIRVTKTSCMGRCGEGPVMAVYPDGVWYRNVSENDIEKIYKEHLIKDKIVPHIVDDIMT
jgi:sirohydrochlorin ferrochelatase/(2Fe-2S) ferredoxin